MITHIRTQGFKGFDLDEDVPEKVIYSGPNKSGKSTRAGAIAIALYGFIPFSTAGKRPGDILDSFGDGKSLVSVVKIGGKEFGRKFSRNEKGVVSMVMQHEGKRTSKENFAVLLSKAGGPKIADVAAFMDQSETKKVDTLFELYPNPELATIDNEIETAKAEVSRLTAEKDRAESTVQRLTNSKNQIELPAGNIAEVQNEINAVEIQIVQIEEQLKQAEIEAAEIKAKAEGERQERERADAEKKEIEHGIKTGEWAGSVIQIDPGMPVIDPNNPADPLDSIPDSPQMQEIDRTISGMENRLEDFKSGSIDDTAKPHEIAYTLKSETSFSIQRIIDALTGAGCGTCAALIVARQELKKYKGKP